MRSSPNYLVVSRSGGDVVPDSAEPSSEEVGNAIRVRRPQRPGMGDGAEVTVHLKVGYKTVLLVVVVFDLIHLSFREVINSSLIEHLWLGLGL